MRKVEVNEIIEILVARAIVNASEGKDKTIILKETMKKINYILEKTEGREIFEGKHTYLFKNVENKKI